MTIEKELLLIAWLWFSLPGESGIKQKSKGIDILERIGNYLHEQNIIDDQRGIKMKNEEKTLNERLIESLMLFKELLSNRGVMHHQLCSAPVPDRFYGITFEEHIKEINELMDLLKYEKDHSSSSNLINASSFSPQYILNIDESADGCLDISIKPIKQTEEK